MRWACLLLVVAIASLYGLNKGILVGTEIHSTNLGAGPLYVRICKYLFPTGITEQMGQARLIRDQAENDYCTMFLK